MKILIIHTFGMGDLLMFTPVLEAIKKNFPRSQVDFLFYIRNNEKIIKNFSNTNKIYFTNRKIINFLKVAKELRKEKYDISIVTSGVKPIKGILSSILIGANIQCGEIKWIKGKYKYFIKKEENLHRLEANLKLVEKLIEINDIEKKYRYYLAESNLKKAEIFYKKNKIGIEREVLGIHPGCSKGASYRRWPAKYYLNLILSMGQKIDIIIFIGPDEEELGDYFQKNLISEKKVWICREKNISDVAAIISKCNYFFNSDSGLGHIAGAFNLKRIYTIFGPENFYKTKVYNANTKIICINNKEKNYYKEIDKNGILKCLSEIKPKEVYNILKKDIKEL